MNEEYDIYTERFNDEVKQLLSGNVGDKDTVNYLAMKITKLYEKHTLDILDDIEK